MGSIYDNEARKNDRAKNRALQQKNTSAVKKAAVGMGAMRAPGSAPGNTSGVAATKGGTPGGTTSNTAKNTTAPTAPSPQKPPTTPSPAASSGASSAVETVLEQELPLEEQISSDEPQQEEEPAFVPIQSRSSAVSVLSGEKQGAKLLSPRELLESRKTGENPALALGRNIAQVKENDAQEAAKNAAAMESASDTARANTQRAADRAKNVAADRQVTEVIEQYLNSPVSGMSSAQKRKLYQQLNGGASADEIAGTLEDMSLDAIGSGDLVLYDTLKTKSEQVKSEATLKQLGETGILPYPSAWNTIPGGSRPLAAMETMKDARALTGYLLGEKTNRENAILYDTATDEQLDALKKEAQGLKDLERYYELAIPGETPGVAAGSVDLDKVRSRYAQVAAQISGIEDAREEQAWLAYLDDPDFSAIAKDALAKYQLEQSRTLDGLERSRMPQDEKAISVQGVMDHNLLGFNGPVENTELAIYLALLETDAQKAQAYHDFIEKRANARRVQRETQETYQYAAQHPITATALGVASAPARVLGAAYMLGSKVAGKDADPNSVWFTPNVVKGASHAGAKEGLFGGIENDFAKQAGEFLYDTGVSIADSALSGGFGKAGGPLLGVGAGTDTFREALESGATQDQAYVMAAASAAFESLFESLDLERLANINTSEASTLLRSTILNGLNEIPGEIATDLANTMVDQLVRGDEGSYRSAYMDYLAQGFTPEQAQARARKDYAKQLGMTAGAAFLSGATMGAGAYWTNPNHGEMQYNTPMLDNAYDQTQRAGGVTPMLDRALDLTKQEGKTPAYTPDAAPAAQDRIASDAEAFLQALEPAKPQAQTDPMVDILLDPQKYLGGQEQTNESTVVNTNPENHTPVQQAVIDAYRSSVDDGLVQYVLDVMNDQVSYREKYNLNPMSDRASADIKALTGVDTTGFQTAIERKTIEHILKRHGEKGIQDRSMRDIHDIARIQYVLDNYDSMKEGGPAEGYTTIKPNGRPKRAQSVVYEKAVNGTYYVVEAVPDTKSKTAYIVSAYMSKNPNEKAGAFRLADAAKRPPYVTSETGYAATPAHDENAHQLLLHGQSLPQSMADDISVNNRLASAEPAVNTNMLKTGGNDAQNRPFTAGDISVQNTAASWQSADLEGRAKTPEQFRQRIHEQPYQQTIDAVKAAKEKARDARISAQKIKSVLGLDNAGRELFDLLVKNPGDQKSAALAVSQYGGRFMTAVQMQIDARTAKQQADAYARAIASARLEKAKELTSGLRFAPASAMKSAGNWFRNSDEVFLRTFGNTQRTRDFHRATVGMVDANEALRVTDLNQTLSQFESMRLNAAESALEQLISDTGLRQDHQTLMTAADLQRIAGADLTAQDTRRLAEIARRMQRETARAMKAIQKAGMDARSAMQETDAAKLPPQVGAAVRAYETAMEPLYAQARQVTDNERVQDIVALCGAGWINPQAVETLHDFSVDKILNAKEKLDAYYEKTWQDASDVYVLGGYDPIGHIAGYRPHTLGRQLQQKSGILGQAQALFGRLTDSALPLEIAGRTEDFKPGRRYMPNFQNSRTGFEGYLDSMAGLAQYAPAASHVVYHTGDIQMLRALGANIRLENASDTVRGDYLRILQNNELSDTEKQAAAASLPWGQSGAAAPFVTWLDEYTNIVAGKTSTIDRVAEKAVGRATLDFMAGIKRMTGAAMVKYNIGSAVSNLAPLFQAGDLGSVSMTKGLVQSTLDALSGNLSFYDQFDFVKNRLTQTQADLGYDRGVKAAAQKAGNFDLMGLVDAPVTRALARAYYNQAIRDGYSESEAVLHTNERLNSVMGGRSLGQNPLIFESKTLGPLTQYKRESYRDLWMRQRDMVDAIRADTHLTDAQKRARIVSSMARFTVGTAVFGEATGSALGYVVAFSPIHVIAEMLKAAGMLEDDNDEDKLGQELMQIWDDVKARLSGQEAQRTVAQALGDFFNIRIGDGLAAQEYEGLSDVAKALLAPLWEEVPMVGSRQGQGSMPVINQGIALVGSAAQAWDILFSDMDAQDKATALAQGIGKQTARTFVPGGNQLQKTALGAADLLKGYHEGYNAKDGALQAQYALSQDPTDIVQTLLFGPSANAGARAYYESGSWPLRDAQQTRLDQLVSGGATYQEAFSQIREHENLLKDLGLSLSSDTESMQPLLEAVKQGRMDVQTAKQAVLSGREATGIQDTDGKTVSGSVRNEALTDYLKLGLDYDQMRLMFVAEGWSTGLIDQMERAQKSGIAPETYMKVFLNGEDAISEYHLDGLIESVEAGWDADAFVRAVKIEAGTQGVKDADGRTISGSKKYNIVKGLENAGYTDEQIAWFLTVRSDTDGEPMYRNMDLTYGSDGGTTGDGSISAPIDHSKDSRNTGDAYFTVSGGSGAYNEKRATAQESYSRNMKITPESAGTLFDALYQIKGENRIDRRMAHLKSAGVSESGIAWIWTAPTQEGGFGYKSDYRKYYYDGYGASTGANGRSSGGYSGGASRSSSSGRAKNPAAAQAFMKRWGLTGNPWGGSAVLGQSDYASRLGMTQSAAKRLDGMIPLLAAMDRAAQESFLRAMGVSESGIAWLTGTPVAQGGLRQA